MIEAGALGLDAGSTTVKLVAVDEAGTMVWHRVEETEPDLTSQVEELLESTRKLLHRVDELPLIATGYGRGLVKQAGRKVTEITCHARGAYQWSGGGGTLIDIGGQDTKAMIMDRSGAVTNFVMNDKCAAGTGRFLEVCARRLRLSLDELSSTALSTETEVSISSTCTVFAESEIISLIAGGHPVPEIVRGLHRALLGRVGSLARGAGLRPPVMLSGGVAQSRAVRMLLAEELQCEVKSFSEPQLTGAYGAALLGLA